MGIITISRGSYSKGKEIAEKLAQNLGYECISRDVLLEASQEFNIPEVKLVRAIHDAPSILDRFTHGKERYINFIREELLKHFQKDNIVYHGLAGHFFVQGIPNILKVRIIANMEDRIREEMARENITEKEARHLLVKDDEERRKWSMFLYGIDTKSPDLYDVTLHIDNLTVDDAVEILADIAQRPCFQTTSDFPRVIKDCYLAAKAKNVLFDRFPYSEVSCKNGIVHVSIESSLSREEMVIEKVRESLREIPDLKEVRVHIVPVRLM